MFNEWYLARDKGYPREAFVKAAPTRFSGITKHKGCIEYRTTTTFDWEGGTQNQAWLLTPRQCKEIFGHYPKKGELLCVKKTRKGWKSEKIELEFTD